MGNISQNFNRHEFRCKDLCGLDSIDHQTLQLLELIRAKFGRPVKVHSGHRCAVYNRRVGGAKDSQHLWGRAADISINGISPKQIYDFINGEYPHEFGFGLYLNFVHIDTRTRGPARW